MSWNTDKVKKYYDHKGVSLDENAVISKVDILNEIVAISTQINELRGKMVEVEGHQLKDTDNAALELLFEELKRQALATKDLIREKVPNETDFSDNR